VALDSTRLVIDGRVETLSPGMTVTAEIKTGRRSVISYLLSPLRRYGREGIRGAMKNNWFAFVLPTLPTAIFLSIIGSGRAEADPHGLVTQAQEAAPAKSSNDPKPSTLWPTNQSDDQISQKLPAQPIGRDIATVQIGGLTLHVPRSYIDQSDGFQNKFGYLKIKVLLPCLSPETPENAAEFHKNTLGNTAVIRLSVADSHDLTGNQLLAVRLTYNQYAHNYSNQAHHDPEFAPGFDLYRNDLLSLDIFVLRGSSPLFVLECLRSTNVPFPACFRREIVEGSMLLEYRFSRSFIEKSLATSLSIDANVRKLVSAFIASASEQKLSNKEVCE